mmetsp:Transcript_54245/g.94602  ORF Transcript_54245/g.94602 Transcript_54245/m.94602 type:complete len:208 (-) Transcript_54245:368-991(-)
MSLNRLPIPQSPCIGQTFFKQRQRALINAAGTFTHYTKRKCGEDLQACKKNLFAVLFLFLALVLLTLFLLRLIVIRIVIALILADRNVVSALHRFVGRKTLDAQTLLIVLGLLLSQLRRQLVFFRSLRAVTHQMSLQHANMAASSVGVQSIGVLGAITRNVTDLLANEATGELQSPFSFSGLRARLQSVVFTTAVEANFRTSYSKCI